MTSSRHKSSLAQLKRLLRHFLPRQYMKWLLVPIGGFLLLTAILSFSIVGTLFVAEHNGRLDRWVKESTGWNLQYKNIHVGWHAWHPSLVLSDLSLRDPQNEKVLFLVNRFQVDLAIWPSLMARAPMTSDLIIDGTDLNLTELPSNEWEINGMVLGTDQQSSDVLRLVLAWLLDQNKMSMMNLHIHTVLASGDTYDFTPMSVDWFGKARHFSLDTGIEGLSDGHLKLNAVLTPPQELTNLNAWKINFNGSISADDFADFFNAHRYSHLQWIHGSGGINFSGYVSDARLQEAQLMLAFNDLKLAYGETQKLSMPRLEEQIFWQSLGTGNQGWELRVQPVDEFGTHVVAGDRVFLIQYQPQDQAAPWTLSARNVDLNVLGQWIHFWFAPTDQLAAVWVMFSPKGHVSDLEVKGGPNKGTLQLQADHLVFAENALFPQGLPASNVTMDSTWQMAPNGQTWKVLFSHLNLSNDHLSVETKGSLLFSKQHPDNPYVNISAHLKGNNLEAVRDYYIPQAGVATGLSHWLSQGLVQLPEVQAHLIWKGLLHDFPYVDQPGVFHLEVKVQNASIQPWDQWPLLSNMDVSLIFNKQQLMIDAPSATTDDVLLKNLHFEMPDMRVHSLSPIVITAMADPEANKILNYLADMPLTTGRLKDALKNNFDLTGHVPLDLKLTIPLKKGELPVVMTGTATFGSNDLYRLHEKNGLWLKDLQGVLHFQNQYLSSGSLKFMFKDQNFNVQLLSSPVNNLHFLIPSVSLYGETFKNVNAYIQQVPDNTPPPINNPVISFELNDDNVKGTVTLEPAGNIDAHLQELILQPLARPSSPAPASDKGDVSEPAKEAPAPSPGKQVEANELQHLSLLLSQLPALKISAQQFYYGADPLGTLNVTTTPMTDGIDIQRLVISNPYLTIDLAGSIVNKVINKNKGQNEDDISLAGQVSGDNYGAFLTSLGYPNFLNGGNGTIRFEFGWLGALLKPDWTSFQGRANFDLNNGKFLNINAGLANLLGLVSLNTVFNAISFNFKGMFQEGLPFDNFNGMYVVTHGIAHTDRFIIIGPSVNINIKGDIDLVNDTLDQTLIIQPQVGNSIALAAAFIGGPVVGAATWVANQILGHTVLRNTGLVYHVTGPLTKPDVVMVTSDNNK